MTGAPRPRVRMTGEQRRRQLLDVGRELFAERGYEGTSIEEIAARADVSEPVVYEHFGGKEGLYAVVVDREMQRLLDYIGRRPTDGFRILARDSSLGHAGGSFATILNDVATQVEGILSAEFKRQGLDPKHAPIYAQMLVGMVASTGQWWLDAQHPGKREVAAHLVNLSWNGLSHLKAKPTLVTDPGR